MELNEFIENFASQFDDTDSEAFRPDTEFRTLGEWSSLLALSILAMIDEEYDVTLKSDELKSAATIEELYHIVARKTA